MQSMMGRARGVLIPVIGTLVLALAAIATWQLGDQPAADAAPKVALAGGTHASAEASTSYLLTCSDEPVSEPLSYQLLCGLGLDAFDQLEWTNWGEAEARAEGRYEEKICDPNCAAGSVISYPVFVTVEDLEPQDGASFYRSLTVEFPGMRPGWAKGASESFDIAELHSADAS